MACFSRLDRAIRRWRARPNGSRKNEAASAHQALRIAAVDRDIGAVNEGGAIGGEEQRQVRDFLGRPTRPSGVMRRKASSADASADDGASPPRILSSRSVRIGPGLMPDDADTGFRTFVGERLGEMIQRSVGGTADHVITARIQCRRADDVDDHAAAVGLHRWQDRARHPHIAEKLEPPVVEPGLVVEFEEFAGTGAAGVIDQDIDAAEAFDAIIRRTA